MIAARGAAAGALPSGVGRPARAVVVGAAARAARLGAAALAVGAVAACGGTTAADAPPAQPATDRAWVDNARRFVESLDSDVDC